jgi:putative transposon-encoded protein
MGISINLHGSSLIEKTPSDFGNGSHILVPRSIIGKTAKIIFGRCSCSSGKLSLNFFNSEIIERQIKPFGTGAHIIVPKEYSGKKLKIIVGGKK